MDRSQRTHLRRPVRALIAALWAAVIVAALPSSARADEVIAVGIYAPSLPFTGPVARLELVSRLASEVAEAVGADRGVGRAYGKAADFAAAVRRGELHYAVLDAPYSAALGNPYPVLATGMFGGNTQLDWHLLTSGDARTVLELEGARIAVARVGARDGAFLQNVLFSGELPRSFFERATFSPDARSAVAAVELGRADAAFVPANVPRQGLRTLFTASPVALPVLVALPAADRSDRGAVMAAAARFTGDSALPGFARGDGGSRALARRFARRPKRGLMAVPPLRLGVRRLTAGQVHRIERPALDQTFGALLAP